MYITASIKFTDPANIITSVLQNAAGSIPYATRVCTYFAVTKTLDRSNVILKIKMITDTPSPLQFITVVTSALIGL